MCLTCAVSWFKPCILWYCLDNATRCDPYVLHGERRDGSSGVEHFQNWLILELAVAFKFSGGPIGGLIGCKYQEVCVGSTASRRIIRTI